MAKLLDGRWLSKLIQQQITDEVSGLVGAGKRPPGLGVILVGDNPASLAYVGRKEKIAKSCGFHTDETRLPQDASREELLEKISAYNHDSAIDGILLQLPLPDHLDADEMLDTILPEKDADGLHPLNQGLLLRGSASVKPCTPAGAMRLIDLAYAPVEPGADGVSITDIPEKDLSGKSAVVVGRSILVGKPVAALLLERNATVTTAHSRTPDLPAVCREADIIVAAVGRESLIQGDWLQEGAVVIDVGINRTSEGKLTGDVDFESAKERVSAITPVPGGAGPMTVIMLMNNTLTAFKAREGGS